jgi:hypothetical protein
MMYLAKLVMSRLEELVQVVVVGDITTLEENPSLLRLIRE